MPDSSNESEIAMPPELALRTPRGELVRHLTRESVDDTPSGGLQPWDVNRSGWPYAAVAMAAVEVLIVRAAG